MEPRYLLRPPKRGPLESVHQAELQAWRRIPRPVFAALVAGSQKGSSLDDNLRAFDEICFVPRVGMGGPNSASLNVEVLGMKLSMPILLAPVGAHAVRPNGEAAAARAAAAAGTGIVHSCFASQPFSDIAQANPHSVAQLYWMGNRGAMQEYVARAMDDGARALVITLDLVPGPAPRDWGTPRLPTRLRSLEAARYATAAARKPAWLLRFLAAGGLPSLQLPNLATATTPAPSFVGGRAMIAEGGMPTWQDIAWLRSLWPGPFLVKGVMHPEDARRAVGAGATAVSVSNHGGNNLDGSPSALRLLPTVADAVGGEVEVLYDGGIRQGGDVAKALALGARAVLVGRAWVFALAARGERGVLEVLTALRAGLNTATVGVGRHDVARLTRGDVVLPPSFLVALPAHGAHDPE